jgi:glycosyltransferase involved in cell wall biosynthesis
MVKDLPKISIVTPSFNQAKFLEATIQSVLGQGYPNLEYIIVDGGSTDGSLEIIKKYAVHLHFWCSEPDGGHYNAINKGFAHATGEIMAWLNSDDMYFPWTLRTVASIMSELPQVEWLTSLSPGIWDWQGFCLGFRQVAGYSKKAFLDGNFLPSVACIQQESTFWRRSIWEKAGGYISTDYKLASDFDLWTRFYLHTELFGVTSPMGGFRYQENQQSCQKPEQYLAEAQASLANMRTRVGWKPNTLKSKSYQFKLNRIPKIGKHIESLYSYKGYKIIREKPEFQQGGWRVEFYEFNY